MARWASMRGSAGFGGFATCRFGIDACDLYSADALLGEADLLCGALGQIDAPATNIGASIVDAHFYRAPIARIGYQDGRAERQGARGRSQIIGIVSLAAGRRSSRRLSAHVRRLDLFG